MRYAVLSLLVLIPGSRAAGQDVPTFRSDVSNVRIDVQVTTGKFVIKGLGPSEFELLDNGVRQPLLYAALDVEPIDLLLLLDVSGSMRDHVAEMASVATDALRHLRKGDRVAVMVFAKKARLTTELTAEMDRIPSALLEAAKDETVGAETFTNAAIMEAVEYLDRASDRLRRAVLILTDNLGENYRLRDEEVIEALLRSSMLLESIVIGRNVHQPPPGTRPSKDPDITLPNVFWIASETGGEAVVSTAAVQAFPDLVARIRVRYSLQYRAPAGTPGQFRRVEVRLAPAIRMKFPDAKVLSRRGYYVRE